MKPIRVIVVLLVAMGLVFISFGWKAVDLDWISQEVYRFWSVVIGSSASVVALLAFLRPPLTRQDLKSESLEDIKLIAATAHRLEELSEKKTEAQSEIEKLERQKAELSWLVQKGSLVLHLQSKVADLEGTILEQIKSSKALKETLDRYGDALRQLSALDEEAQENEDLREIIDILERSEYRERRLRPKTMLDYFVDFLFDPVLLKYLR